MRLSLQRLQSWAERRLPALTRYRRHESLPIELHRRRIYIVPTGFGIGFSVLLMVMLAGALNYANNAALLLTCLLGAATSTSMLVAFRTLNGLRLSHIHAGHAVAGQPIELTLTLDSTRGEQRFLSRRWHCQPLICMIRWIALRLTTSPCIRRRAHTIR